MNKTTATARDLREFFNADPKRLAALSADARKTVEVRADGTFPKGRLHKEAVAVHNKRRKVQYVTGNTKVAAAEAAQVAKAARAKAAKAGVPVGARGRLSKEAMAVVTGKPVAKAKATKAKATKAKATKAKATKAKATKPVSLAKSKA